MTFSGFGGWQFGLALADTLNEVLAYLQVDDFSSLGTSAASGGDQNLLAAAILNRTIARYLNANPALGETNQSLTLVSGTNSYAIPATLRNYDILKLQYSDTGQDPYNDDRELYFYPRGAQSGIDPVFLNGTAQNDHPDAWLVSEDGANLIIMPTPSEDGVIIKVHFRARATAYTAANIYSALGGGAVTIAEVATIHQDVLALGMAAELAKFIRSATALVDRLRMLFDNPYWMANGQPMGALQRSQWEIADAQASWAMAGTGQVPRTGLLATEIAAGSFISVGESNRLIYQW